jgi:hypothetical protein
MRKNILTAVLTGFLMLGGSLVLAEKPRPSGQNLANAEIQVQQGAPIPSFEQRLSLKPLSDEELAQISAGGLGSVMPFPFQPFLFLPYLFQTTAFPNNDFSSGRQTNTFQSQGITFVFGR